MEKLSSQELADLIRRVFVPGPQDKALAFIVDLPDEHTPDDERWAERRKMAHGWAEALAGVQDQLGMDVRLYLYRNVRHNNADLPATACLHQGGPLPATADSLTDAPEAAFETIFTGHQILIAPTRFSATAPLKLAAKTYGFRAATMPGFAPSMIPALRLDYTEINGRCLMLKGMLDPAVGAQIEFLVDGRDGHSLYLDLRHRPAHASGGLFPNPGTAGNLPSGETYIVPYEGEVPGDPSQTRGIMPVQFGDELVLYEIEANKALHVATQGPESTREAGLLSAEPAYGNISELGLGVLADYGLEPTGEILLDEKLALHIAFGRSDHFGGQVGAKDFSGPEAVVHIDRVYLPQTQPRISVVSVDILGPGNKVTPLIRDDKYVVDF